jgi:hypothetical protein
LENDPNTASTLDRLGLQFCIWFLTISSVLTGFAFAAGYIISPLSSIFIFSKLSDAEVFDRSSVFVLLVLISFGVVTSTQTTKFFTNRRPQIIVASLALLMMILSMGWNWGDSTIAQYGKVYWYGWGDKLALASLIVSIGAVFLVSNFQNPLTNKNWDSLKLATDLTAITLLVIFYLPSLFQSFKGIIDLYHSRFFLNDLLIYASGKMPYADINPQYVGALGIPLRFLSFLPGEYLVNATLIWVNLLVAVEILLLALVTKRAINLKSWPISFFIPVAIMFMKVQPNTVSFGSLAQNMNLFPGRTLLPILIIFVLSEIAERNKGRSTVSLSVLLGGICTLTTFNNFEFGFPASIVAVIALIFLCLIGRTGSRHLVSFILAVVLSAVALHFFYKINGSTFRFQQLLTNIQAFGVNGFMNEPMPKFGLWIFFFSILGTSSIIGATKLFGLRSRVDYSVTELRSSVTLLFAGLWGSSTLFYFSGRSLVPVLVVYLIPLSLCIIGFVGLVRGFLSAPDESKSTTSKSFRIVLVPLFVILSLPIVSITQAPNPSYELLRLTSRGERWSSRALKQQPKYQEMLQIIIDNPKNEYVYMGNDGPAYEVMSDVPNALGIISVEDLLVSKRLNEVGCAPAFESGADYALIPKVDWANPPLPAPCDGFVFAGLNPDSEFLIYAIPSKVSS